MSVKDRVRVRDVTVLSDNHYLLKKTVFDWRRSNGEWQTQTRETYDRGNGATILLYHPQQRTVILTRQFRKLLRPSMQRLALLAEQAAHGGTD